MIKYEEIWVVDLESDGEVHKNCIILKDCSNEEITGFDVDLTGDFWFNTSFKYLKIKSKSAVSTLKAVIQYCDDKKVEIRKELLKNDGLIVGGERDFLINDVLDGNWVNNI